MSLLKLVELLSSYERVIIMNDPTYMNKNIVFEGVVEDVPIKLSNREVFQIMPCDEDTIYILLYEE